MPSVSAATAGPNAAAPAPPPTSAAAASRSSRSATLTSAISSASAVSRTHMPTRAAEVGPRPAGAVTAGRASMPAPTVDPVMSAIAPKVVPMAAALGAAGTAVEGGESRPGGADTACRSAVVDIGGLVRARATTDGHPALSTSLIWDREYNELASRANVDGVDLRKANSHACALLKSWHLGRVPADSRRVSANDLGRKQSVPIAPPAQSHAKGSWNF